MRAHRVMIAVLTITEKADELSKKHPETSV